MVITYVQLDFVVFNILWNTYRWKSVKISLFETIADWQYGTLFKIGVLLITARVNIKLLHGKAVWSCFKLNRWVYIYIYIYKRFFQNFNMLRCLRCVPPNFVFDSRMLRLCGYLSVGQLNNGKWLNIPFYFNNEWSRNCPIWSRRLLQGYTGYIRKKPYTVGKFGQWLQAM